MLVRTAARAFVILIAGGLLAGCYDRKQTGIINPDGSGKVVIDTDVAVPAFDAPGKEKPAAIDYGRQLAADLITNTQGVDAWSDVAVSPAAEGHVHYTATAYFPDITKLRFDVPLVFRWQRNQDGTHTFAIERFRNEPAATRPAPSDAELKGLVASAQAQYKQQHGALETALSVYKLRIEYTLPGEITASHILEKNGHAVSITLEGKKIIAALDKFVADDVAMAATIKSGKDMTDNDDILLEGMYGQKGPVSATVKMAADAAPAFDYATEMRAAARGQAEMLKAAGVVLIPPFIVQPPPAAPAGK